jgi:hypothetical protein
MTPEEIQELQELEELERLEAQYGEAPSKERPQPAFPYKKRMTPIRHIGVVETTPQEDKDLASIGVDVDTPTPEGLETGKRAFAQEQAWTDFANARLGQLVPGSKYGVVEGVPVWYNPKTKLWTKMRDSSLGQGMLRVIGEQMTGAGGFATMFGPQGATPASAIALGAVKAGAATGALEGTRQAIGRALGVNEANIAEITKDVAKAGALASAGEVAGGGIVQGAKWIKNTVKGRPVMPPELAEELLNDIGEYDELFASIGAIPPIHQTAKDGSFAAGVAQTLWQDAGMANTEIGTQIARINNEVHQALGRHIDTSSAPFNAGIPEGPESKFLAGQPVHEGIHGDIRQGLRDRTNIAQADRIEADMAGEALPMSQRESAMGASARVREQMLAQRTQAKAQSDESYLRFRQAVGMSDELKSQHRVRITDKATLNALENHIRNKETGELVAGNKPHFNADGSVSVDLGTLWKASQRARAVVRNKKNPTILDEDVQRSEELITKAMHDYIKDEAVAGRIPADSYKLLQEADATYRQYKAKWDEGFRADFLEQTRGGKWAIKDQHLLSSIIRGRDLEAAVDLKEIIKGDPVAMNEMRKALLGVVGSQITKNGAASAKAMHKFMNDDGYRPMIELFFDSKTYGQVDTFTDLAQAAERSQADLKKAQGLLRARFGEKFVRMQPEQFVNYVFKSGTSFEDARLLTKTVMRYPGAYEALQNGIANEIKKKAFPDGPTGKVNLSALNKMVNDQGTQIAAVMGGKYMNDLRTVSKTLSLIEREAVGNGAPSNMNRLQKFFRGTLVRPFSREGNILHWLAQNRGDNIAPQVLEILTNKNSLSHLASTSRRWLDRTKAGSATGAVLGSQAAAELQRD